MNEDDPGHTTWRELKAKYIAILGTAWGQAVEREALRLRRSAETARRMKPLHARTHKARRILRDRWRESR